MSHPHKHLFSELVKTEEVKRLEGYTIDHYRCWSSDIPGAAEYMEGFLRDPQGRICISWVSWDKQKYNKTKIKAIAYIWSGEYEECLASRYQSQSRKVKEVFPS